MLEHERQRTCENCSTQDTGRASGKKSRTVAKKWEQPEGSGVRTQGLGPGARCSAVLSCGPPEGGSGTLLQPVGHLRAVTSCNPNEWMNTKWSCSKPSASKSYGRSSYYGVGGALHGRPDDVLHLCGHAVNAYDRFLGNYTWRLQPSGDRHVLAMTPSRAFTAATPIHVQNAS